MAACYKRAAPTEPRRFCPRRRREIIAQGKAASAADLVSTACVSGRACGNDPSAYADGTDTGALTTGGLLQRSVRSRGNSRTVNLFPQITSVFWKRNLNGRFL